MNLSIVTEKLEPLTIATKQLNTAIDLFLSNLDFLSSLTLAGAAEEILGKLLEKEGKEPVLHRLVQLTAIEYEKEKDVFNFYNKFRNAYKHLDEDLGYVSTNYMAMIMIERGCCNYRSLLDSETKQIDLATLTRRLNFI